MVIAIDIQNVSLSFKLYKTRNIKQSIMKRDFKDGIEKVRALNNISFSVKKGEVLGVIGPNGCGKSTLLKVISKILHPDEGRLIVNGTVSPLLGLGSGFNPELDGVDNIYLNGLLLGYKKSELDNKLEEIIEFTDLGHFIYQPIKTYSSGMKARLAFSIAAHLEPDILLIDEVLGVGDIKFQKKSSDKIKDIIKSNATVILVSHSQSVLRELSDRVLWMQNGKVIELGDPEQVLINYTNANK